MPPSPSFRRSPGMESRSDIHKRGRSLESGLSFKERDDDLALFNEMQSREAENFLLQPTDDFDDILSSRVKPFPDFKLGITIPARGESSDLLNADGNKNDYDWLLTPPDTPLFPSLDDEPEPVNIIHSGRERSRPISISRSSTMERSHRSSRGSPSPQRLSPSPRSGISTFRGRPSSAPHASTTPLRSTSPSRRPSPPPLKPSTPPPRSSMPTSRRTSVGSGGSSVTQGLRGTSPARTTRGNSASPKIRAWQSNIPGFSLEAPPNLRTSLADRPASYVRGSSPASRTSPSRPGRHSMSPTATRSISSSHSHERDMLSIHSRGSVASSGDDDADSLQSVPVNLSDRPMSRRGVGGLSNSRPAGFSKKPMKTFSPSSAPKRSFDSAMRQMDRKSPQNMFRPLLSSVPSSTFYAGKANVAHRTMISRNSSVTTSSNASSDQATSGAHDTEGSDQYQDDMTSDCVRTPFSDVQDEVFAFDKMDVVIEDAGPKTHDPCSELQHGKPDKSFACSSHPSDSKESIFHVCDVQTVAASEALNAQGDENTLLCSRCGCQYLADELIESEHNICPECKKKERILTNSMMITSEESNVTESIHVVDTKDNSQADVLEENTLQAQACNCSDNAPPLLMGEESGQTLPEQQVIAEHRAGYSPSRATKNSDKSNSNVDIAEAAGISVLLLKRSSSFKGPLIHGRTFNSSAISYDDLSYARDLTSSMRSSIGHGSMSTTSSIDLSSARHVEMLMQPHLSGKRSSDTSSKPQSTVSSFSATSMQVFQGLGALTSSHEETYEGSVNNIRHIVAGETTVSPDEILALENAGLHDAVSSFAKAAQSEEANVPVVVSVTENDRLDNSQALIGSDEVHVQHQSDKDAQKSIDTQKVEESAFLKTSAAEETTDAGKRNDQKEIADDQLHSLSTTSEIELGHSHPSSPRSQIDTVSREDLIDTSAVTCPEKDVKGAIESDTTDGIIEESKVTVEDPVGRRTRSLTLEEATDTILFCSSLIHDLAYKAASIAIEKEKENLEPLEGSRPTVTIPDRYGFNRKDPPGRTTKAQKARKRRVEMEAKLPLTNNDDDERSNDENSVEPVVHNVGLPKNSDSMKPPKLESKCNCTIM